MNIAGGSLFIGLWTGEEDDTRLAMDQPTDPGAPDRELVERVVAWHNRLPGTRRIEARHVTGIGVVALPFAASARVSAPPTGMLRWLGRVPALLSKPLIARLRASRVAAFAWRHGAAARPGPAEWPLRTAAPARSAAGDLQWRYLRTAAVELGSRRHRVLIGGPGRHAAVLGSRHWNPQRLRGLLVAAATVIATAVGSTLFIRHEQATTAPALEPVNGGGGLARAAGLIAAPASAPVLEDAAPAASLTPSTAPAPALASASAPAPALTPPPPPSPEVPPVAENSQTPRAPPGNLDRPLPSTRTDEAQLRGSDARRPPSAGAQPASSAPASASAPAAAPAATAAQRSGAYSLATRPTRNRAATELRILLMDPSLVPRGGAARIEAVQTPGGWRAVVGPFADRGAAERAHEVLRRQGVQVEPIGF